MTRIGLTATPAPTNALFLAVWDTDSIYVTKGTTPGVVLRFVVATNTFATADTVTLLAVEGYGRLLIPYTGKLLAATFGTPTKMVYMTIPAVTTSTTATTTSATATSAAATTITTSAFTTSASASIPPPTTAATRSPPPPPPRDNETAVVTPVRATGETVVTVGVGIGVGVSVVTGGTASSGLVRNDLLDSLVRCSNKPRQRSVAANPTQMELGGDEARYWRGTLVGDTIIVGCCVAVFIGGAALYALVSGRGFIDVLLAARLPGRLTFVWTFLAPAATTAIVAVATYGTDDPRASVVLAAILGFAVVAVPAALHFVVVHYARTTLVLVEVAAPGAEASGLPPGDKADDELTPLGSWVAWCFAPIDGREWPAAHPLVRTCGDVFDHLRSPLFLVLDVVGNVVVCALLGVFQSTKVRGHLCKPVSATVAAVLLLQLGVAIAWQPFISRFYMVVHMTFTVVGALMAMIAVMAQFEVYDLESARSAVDVCYLAQGGVALVFACAAIFGAAFERFGCGRRARAQIGNENGDASPVGDELHQFAAASPAPALMADAEAAPSPAGFRVSDAVTRQVYVVPTNGSPLPEADDAE